MSGLDVLAVMDAAILRNGHRGDNPGELRMQQEARAAVAELIEAADNVFHNAPNGPYMERLAKALDFMTGEAS